MKTKWMRLLPLLLLLVLVGCTGCGNAGENENTKQGMTLIEELDYEGALGCFEQALVSGEDIREIYRGQGIAYMGLTQYDKAIEAFGKFFSESSSIPNAMDYDVNYYLAVAHYKNGELQKAKEIYDAILNMKSKEKDAYFMRGSILLELGKYEEAKLDFDQAIELDPYNYDQLVSIFQVLDQFGYREIGHVYLQQAIDNAPKDITNFDKGRIYYYMDDYELARNYLEQARDAGDAQAAYYLGKTWEALGEYNYAASVYNSYLKDQEKSALIYNQLALCYMQLEDYDAALSAIEEGLQLEDKTFQQVLSFNRIVIYEYQGDFKKAAALMAAYKRNYPDDEEALREYEFLKTR